MYRAQLGTKDRGGAIAAVIAIHAALLFAFLHMAGRIDIGDPQQVVRLFDLRPVKPSPPPPPPHRKTQPRPKAREGGSAPKNIKSEATPVVAPKPKIRLPRPPRIAAAETPRQGTETTQGASNIRGPGTGAGGVGTGTGSGAGGTGPGGGGDNAVAEPPHLVSPVLLGRDLPRGLLDNWPARGTVFLRLRIDSRGYISECAVDRGTGVQAIDSVMCNLAHDRLRFRPALNRSGQPVAGWFGYAQPAPR